MPDNPRTEITGADETARSPAELIPEIHARLEAVFGLPDGSRRTNPTEELVRTILSQNTNDVNRDRAYESMWTRFGSWEAVAAAPTEELSDAIRPGGLSDIKAPRIQNALHAIRERAGTCDLSFICALCVDEGDAWLQALPGVGPKTSACVLLFSCGKPVMPVDTHVHRVTGRLGLIPAGTSANAAHSILTRLVQASLVYPLHINLIRHGRQTCRAGRPLCEECTLLDLCPYGRRLLGTASQ